MKKLELLILSLFLTLSIIEVMIEVSRESRDAKWKIYGGLQNKEGERINGWTQV